MVFVVRKGNPKGIKDWNDLVRPDVQVITPNPKTSGGARWNYLAAWGYALQQNKGSEAAARDFVARLYKNVPVLDAGARGSTTTFVERGIGDVLIAWENEALLAMKQLGPDKFDIVIPSVSILAEPPVAVNEAVAAEARDDEGGAGLPGVPVHGRGAGDRREALLPSAPARGRWRSSAATFPKVPQFTIDKVFGGWAKAQKTHFADGGVFDQIYRWPEVTDCRAPSGAARDAARRGPCCPGCDSPWASRSRICCVLVIIPLSTLFVRTARLGWGGFWRGGHVAARDGGVQAERRYVGRRPRS